MELIRNALAEDLGTGDVTGAGFVPAESISTAVVVAREECRLSGVEVAERVFFEVDSSLSVVRRLDDGASALPGDRVLEISGSTRWILAAERVALNFLQQLSGVATATAAFVKAVEGTGAKILDTRKTVPGLRELQKQAVLHGGGCNHRFGLFDMALVKDNHLATLGEHWVDELRESVARFRQDHPGLRVEVEADTVRQALEMFSIPGIDVVLLDNMKLEELRQCVRSKPKGILLEASGGINLATARPIAETGVDYLSVGSLTHSPKAIDFALDF